jgi:hypothetical protein
MEHHKPPLKPGMNSGIYTDQEFNCIIDLIRNYTEVSYFLPATYFETYEER